MWAAAARRFLALLGAGALFAALLGLLIAAAASGGRLHGFAIGFYCVGILLLVVGFLTASRPPVRTRGGEGGGLTWVVQSRPVRWATRTEQDEVLNLSAVLIAIGFCLIAIGVVVDGRVS
jgi:uncharacterized membrane protein